MRLEHCEIVLHFELHGLVRLQTVTDKNTEQPKKFSL